MKYFLQPNLLAPPPPVEISEEDYIALERSKKTLLAAFSFEENYDLLIGNYLELEKSALSITVTSMARREHEYHDFFELNAEMNRRALNFLSSARLFVDQIRQRVATCGVDADEVKKYLNSEYDKKPEYRFMEAIRNHVQHSGSAVHSLSIGSAMSRNKEIRKNIYTLGVFTHKNFLELDKKFKKRVLFECADKIDFLMASRIYIESLSGAQDFSRMSMEENLNEARDIFSGAIFKYQSSGVHNAFGLHAFHVKEDGSKEKVSIFLDWDDVRLKLKARNGILRNMHDRLIANMMI